MPYDALRIDILKARDRRQTLLDGLFLEPFPATLMLSLNLPGEEKTGPRAERLFAWGEQALLEALPVVAVVWGKDSLGPFALYRAQCGARQAKLAAMSIEAGHPAGRLLDLDIYDASGRPVDRAALGSPPRPCLICPEPALACIRTQRHSGASLKAQVHAVIDAL